MEFLYLLLTKIVLGLNITKISTADSRNYANIEMSELKLEQNALLGEKDLAGETLEKILDLGSHCYFSRDARKHRRSF
jgi:hypothetical protein